MPTAWVVFLAGLAGLLLEQPSRADGVQGEVGCLGEPALSSKDLGSIPLKDSPIPVGSWKLPTSSAQIRVDLAQDEDPLVWRFQFYFSFIDTKNPWGIPYSFQKIHVTWDTGTQTRELWLDWSAECSTVGRSLYPGQAWVAFEKVSQGEFMPRIENLRIAVFGSRN